MSISSGRLPSAFHGSNMGLVPSSAFTTRAALRYMPVSASSLPTDQYITDGLLTSRSTVSTVRSSEPAVKPGSTAMPPAPPSETSPPTYMPIESQSSMKPLACW